jgi:glycosyltransferase involved in cell wall biosynthesis
MSPYYDITLLCKGGDGDSLVRIAKYAKIIIHTNQTVETDVCIFQTAWGDVPDDKIIAKQYIQMVHGDYEWMRKALNFKYKPRKQGMKHIAVGEFVSNQFKKETKFDAPIIYNLLDTDAHAERVLRLISVTRIGREKGMERIDKMARMLKAAGKKFIWLVYGSGQDKAYEKKIRTMIGDIQEVVFMGSSTDTASMVADSDYLVALSDSEGFSYSIYEALQLGTPCIITDFPSGHEQIEDGLNGYIVRKDLSDLDINKICQHIPKDFKFEERASEEDWIKVIGGNGKKLTKAQQPNNTVKVKARIGYRDMSLNRFVNKDEELNLPEFRAFQLLTMNIVKFI